MCAARRGMDIEPYSAADHVLTVSITGVDGDVYGVDFTIAIVDPCSPEGQFIPQAWRFDPAGCQAGALRITRPASVDGCPGLPPGSGTPTLEAVTTEMIGGFLFPPDNSVIKSPAVLVHFAQIFPTVHFTAGQRYVAAQITFPMGQTVAGADPEGVKCGCAAAPRLLTVIKGGITTSLGDIPSGTGNAVYWVDFVGCAIAPKGPPATDTGSDPACLTTASRSTSWGAIKSQYR